MAKVSHYCPILNQAGENAMGIMSLTETAERAVFGAVPKGGFPADLHQDLGQWPRERPPRGRKDVKTRWGLPTSPTREISRGWNDHVSVNGMIPNAMRYSALRILKEGLTGNRGWQPVWREPEPKPQYDIVIIGGGGHGLSTAYYLAKEFGERNVAVLEKGWLGSGNIGRNTTIIRSNYLLEGNQPFYEFSLKLWEGLEQDFNYNAMVSQRGVLNLCHSDPQRDAFVRRGNAMRLSGADSVILGPDEIRKMCPYLDHASARFPITGALWQPRGGTVRHDAVAWGYARGADQRGVDIIQNCEVTGIDITDGRCLGVETAKGPIKAKKVAMCAAGSSSRVAAFAGMRLPIESHVLQAFVSEGLKPVLPGVITFGAGHFYVSQSDKGGLVFGGDIDGYNSYAQRGNLPVVEDVCEGGMAIMPMIGRARLLRMWGGVMDMSMDGSPFIDRTHVEDST